MVAWTTLPICHRRSARAVLAIYNRNIFPDMNVTWGIYPNNIGHTDFPGCFRCHDEQHVSSDRKTISQDCASCHNVLAMEVAGLSGSILYPGSWSEWCADPARPVATGAA